LHKKKTCSTRPPGGRRHKTAQTLQSTGEEQKEEAKYLATSEKCPSSSRPFSFSFASAGKIAKTIRGLKPTGALGVDTIPVEVLKKGVEVLADPIAHMCNVSFATGVVPAGLKVGKIYPVYKGSGKNRKDPASYRPISILSPLSKVL
jgi:hypothetical protein